MGAGGGSPSIYIWGSPSIYIHGGSQGGPPYIYMGGTDIPVVLEYRGYDGVIHQSRGGPPPGGGGTLSIYTWGGGGPLSI